MRHFLLFLSIIVLTLGVYIGFNNVFFRDPPFVIAKPLEPSQDKDGDWINLSKAESALHDSDYVQALHFLSQHSTPLSEHDELGKKWLDLMIRYHEETSNTQDLMQLYASFPNQIHQHEKASLLVGDNLLMQANKKSYQTLRNAWYGREKNHHSWFILDVDHLLMDGNKQGALDLLHSTSLEGLADSARLIRLALLYITENPKKAWGYLNDAYVKDPLNPKVRIYRAKLLEAAGKNELALKEFQTASHVSSRHPQFQDQLAEYHIRHHQYDEANKIWNEQLLNTDTSDQLWVKAIFWNKVTKPTPEIMHPQKIVMGRYYDLVEYYLGLNPDQFWNEENFIKLPSAKFYNTHETANWLKILQDLKNLNEEKAWIFLNDRNSEDFAWHPRLYQLLKTALAHRLGKDAPPPPLEQDPTPLHPFLTEVETFQSDPENLSPQLNAIISSKDIYSLLFLAAGWQEAALQLPRSKSLSRDWPEWIAYAYTQALSTNRSAKEALSYAQGQVSSPLLSLYMAKLYLQEHESDQALSILKPFANDPKYGFQIALFQSQIYLKQRNYDKAQSMIWNNDQARDSVKGKEILARIALLTEDPAKAISFYSEIVNDSAEAQSYLAQIAYQIQDFKKAKELTEKLLKKNPENKMLQQNLRKILSQLADKQ